MDQFNSSEHVNKLATYAAIVFGGGVAANSLARGEFTSTDFWYAVSVAAVAWGITAILVHVTISLAFALWVSDLPEAKKETEPYPHLDDEGQENIRVERLMGNLETVSQRALHDVGISRFGDPNRAAQAIAWLEQNGLVHNGKWTADGERKFPPPHRDTTTTSATGSTGATG